MISCPKSSKDTAKAIGFLPLIIAILLLIALIFGLKLGENGAFCKEVNFAQWELSAKFSSYVGFFTKKA